MQYSNIFKICIWERNAIFSLGKMKHSKRSKMHYACKRLNINSINGAFPFSTPWKKLLLEIKIQLSEFETHGKILSVHPWLKSKKDLECNSSTNNLKNSRILIVSDTIIYSLLCFQITYNFEKLPGIVRQMCTLGRRPSICANLFSGSMIPITEKINSKWN